MTENLMNCNLSNISSTPTTTATTSTTTSSTKSSTPQCCERREQFHLYYFKKKPAIQLRPVNIESKHPMPIHFSIACKLLL
jgi:hypothetical protein